MTQYYHASTQRFCPNQRVTATCRTAIKNYIRSPEATRLLHVNRPARMLSRIKCVFVADSLQAAYAYISSEGCLGMRPKSHLYSVDIPCYHKGPFAIINEIEVRRKNSRPIGGLIKEYWNPTKNWLFYEYFCPYFTVRNEIKITDDIMHETSIFSIRYCGDKKLARSL